MNKSDSIKELAIALRNFQRLGLKVGKEAENPFFKSKYASLANILDKISTPLSECGLSFTQMPDGKCLTTILMHESGEWIEATYEMPIGKPNDPQAVGSAITYARRYALGAILGLNIDDDDDGNKASEKPAKPVLSLEHPNYHEVVKYLADGGLWAKVEERFFVPKELVPEVEADIARFSDPTGHGDMHQEKITEKVKRITQK